MLEQAFSADWSGARHTGREPDPASFGDLPEYQALLTELLDLYFPANLFAR